MSELLLEIFSEEIPARMQKRATEDLARMVKEGLAKAGVECGEIKTFVAPRRLGLCIDNLPSATPETSEEKKGPKVGAPQPAIDGFVRAAGIGSINDARIAKDEKKGDFYVVDIINKGAQTTDIIAQIVPNIVRSFPWPKSMRWGEGSLRWVRPIHSILCVLGGEVVPFEIDGIKSSNQTLGHRFHSSGTISANNFTEYKSKLLAAHVIIDREERKASILKQAQELCAKNGLELIDDIGLLEEVCGLIDEPFVILGQMDESFLDLPPEVIRLTLRINQKYFVVNSKATGKLAPYFIVVSNVKATDGGKAIAHGNARVLSARLNDARYFWDLDRKQPLESRVAKLDSLVFHEKLGSVGDKVKRIVELAGEIAPLVGADVADAKRAALLAKADLSTEMVGEFPELQGIMGRYYANNDGLKPEIANAIAEHYKPVGPSDNVPTNPVSIAVALADKFDTLVGFFAIGEKPTGSGDPYALRRAALGIIRIILENGVRIRFFYGPLFKQTLGNIISSIFTSLLRLGTDQVGRLKQYSFVGQDTVKETINSILVDFSKSSSSELEAINPTFLEDLNSIEIFIRDRLKVYLRDEGFEHDVIDAVYANQDDDLVRIVNRIKALSEFLKTDDGANLLAGYKRAVNILKAEEKKSAIDENQAPDASLFNSDAERELFAALGESAGQLDALLAKEDFAGALVTLSKLRAPIYSFLDNVLVNDDNQSIRNNRLALLVQLRHQMAKLADFECIR